jgi:hypothetical protein
MLNGWEDSDKGEQWLIELFRSDTEIDRETRNAIADAIERDTGLRLDLVRADSKPTSGSRRMRLQHEYQEIADEVLALIREGDRLRAAGEPVPKQLEEKNAKDDVAKRRRISPRKVAAALRYRRGVIAGITITPRQDT